MRATLDNHLLRSAAETARRFPLGDDAAIEIARNVRDSDIQNPRVENRTKDRFTLDGIRATLTVMHPGGSLASSESVLLDISVGGAGILYPGFLHNATECALHLTNNDGRPVIVPGKVTSCRFATKCIHAIGMEFEGDIDIRQFVPQSQWIEQVAGVDASSNQKLAGRILAVGFDEFEVNMLSVFFAETSLTFESEPYPGAALDNLRREHANIILVDDRQTTDVEQFLRDLRAEGFGEPIILATDRSSLSKQLSSLQDVQSLQKPLQQEMILALVRDHLLSDTSPFNGTKPLRSVLPGLQKKCDAVSAYVASSRAQGEALCIAISEDDTNQALRISSALRNTAAGFGFPLLGEAAAEAVTAINAGGSAKEAARSLRMLVRVIDRLDDPKRAKAVA